MAMMSESTGTLQAAPATEDAPRALSQTLSVRDAVMITVSGVTPASSIFVIAPFAIQQAGSGAVLSFLLGGVLGREPVGPFGEQGDLLGVVQQDRLGEVALVQ